MNLKIEFKKKEFVGKILSILFANALTAFALVFFIKPLQMISGGVNGIAIIIEYLTSIPLGLLVFILNIPLIIISVKLLDREFSLYTIISIFSLSAIISIFEGIKPSGFMMTNDIILGCIYGGVIRGIGSGILFKNNSSSGGFDIIAASIKKYYNISIGRVSLLVNLVIVGISAFIFTPNKAMYTLISLAISYKISDLIQLNVGKQKQVFIISSKNEIIAKSIQEKLSRGITYFEGKGGYENKDVQVIYLICSARELVQVKDLIEEKDKKAFVAVSDTAEIKGRGFKEIVI